MNGTRLRARSARVVWSLAVVLVLAALLVPWTEARRILWEPEGSEEVHWRATPLWSMTGSGWGGLGGPDGMMDARDALALAGLLVAGTGTVAVAPLSGRWRWMAVTAAACGVAAALGAVEFWSGDHEMQSLCGPPEGSVDGVRRTCQVWDRGGGTLLVASAWTGLVAAVVAPRAGRGRAHGTPMPALPDADDQAPP